MIFKLKNFFYNISSKKFSFDLTKHYLATCKDFNAIIFGIHYVTHINHEKFFKKTFFYSISNYSIN